MEKKTRKKQSVAEIWEEDIFDSYLEEMDELVNKYPADPNKTDFDDRKLNKLIRELDQNWFAFQKKWQHKLEAADKVFGVGKVKKVKDGMRHLIIKSEFSGDDILDLTVPDNKTKN
ncbi:MAG: hypothetical protein ABIG64_03980 [Candidatus Omnitrophota bacterium]